MGGSSKKQTVGYRYYLGCHMVISSGPIDAVHAINVADRRAWTGNVTESQAITVNAPELFGGEEREGGIQGTVDILMGEPDQEANSYLESVIDGIIPAFRGVVSIVLRQAYIGTNPYIKPWAFLASRLEKQSQGQPPWYPSRVAIEAPDGYNDMNPAHMIREALTNGTWGLGYSGPLNVDNSSFEAAANRFYNEGLGLSLELTQQEGTEAFIKVILEHADAALQVDPVSGLWTLKPIRDDYDIEELPVADGSNVLEVTRFRRPGWGEMTNQLSLVYDDREGAKEKTVTVQDTALVEVQGNVVAQTVRRPGISHGELAARIAARELRQMSTPLANGELLLNAQFGFTLRVGSAFVFNWEPLGIENLVLRVVAIDYGNLLDGAVRVEFAQDVFATTEAVYAPPPPTGWQPPNNDPVPVADRSVFEAPYWALATDILEEGAQLDSVVDDEGGYVIAAGRQPVGDAYNYAIWTRTGTANFSAQGPGDWVPNGVTSAPMVREVQSTVTLLEARDLEDVEADSLALLGSEWVRVLSVNVGAASVTLARGVLDSPPQEHDTGTRLFFVEEGAGFADQVYFSGEGVDVKLLPTTGLGTLPIGDAPEDEVVMGARALRPYPPGNVRVNGERYPADFITGDYLIEWSHRDRVQQTAYLVQQDEGNIGPEDGTTYTLTIYGDGQQLREETELAGTSYEYDLAQQESDASGPLPEVIRMELVAVRDGYESWLPHVVEFGQEPVPEIADPSELSDLVLWLDSASLDALSDGDPVALWADDSGNDHDFEQATAGNQPTLRKNAWGQEHFVHFDRTRPDFLDGLHSALQIDPKTDDLSLFVVTYQDSGETTGYVISWRDGSDIGYGLAANGDSNPSLYLSGNAAADPDNRAGELLYWGAAVQASQGGNLRVNEAVVDDTTAGSTSAPAGSWPIRLGARGDGAGLSATGYEFSGSVGEIVVYNRRLSGAEILGLESYFRKRWLEDLQASPDQLPGLWSWYSADQITGLSDGDPVDTWPDTAGNAEASQTDPAFQPAWRASGLNGQPYVESDGDYFMELAAALDADDHTLFIVVRGPTQDHNSLATFMHSNRCALYWRDTGNMISVAGAPPTSGAGNRDGNWINTVDGHALWVTREGSSNAEVLRNGTAVATESGANYLSAGDPQLGSSAAGSAFIGEIYEIIVYDRVLGEDERKALEEWAANKYGITFAE